VPVLPLLLEDFITEAEHQALLDSTYLQMRLGRRRYMGSHWDSVIAGFREIELRVEDEDQWPPELRVVTVRMQSTVTALLDRPIEYLCPHLIDLSPTGRISPHVDSVKFSGGIIAGLSLQSTRIMRLQREGCHGDDDVVELLMRPRSLYLLTGEMRFDYAHEVLGAGSRPPLLFPDNAPQRRISLVLRDKLQA
jgi:alkylated DNA repair protein alkB family protein 7